MSIFLPPYIDSLKVITQEKLECQIYDVCYIGHSNTPMDTHSNTIISLRTGRPEVLV